MKRPSHQAQLGQLKPGDYFALADWQDHTRRYAYMVLCNVIRKPKDQEPMLMVKAQTWRGAAETVGPYRIKKYSTKSFFPNELAMVLKEHDDAE